MIKQIKEQPNYSISDKGELFNKDGKKLFLRLNRCGYVVGYYWKNNKQKVFSIHREVAKAFIPNPENKPQVNHIDGNKQNNDVNNLEWVTNQENQLHAYKLGLNKPRNGASNNNAVITEEQAKEICRMFEEGYRNCDVSRITGVVINIVKLIKARRSWVHISKDYSFTKKFEQASTETVKWVCKKLEEGFRSFEIVDISDNPKVTRSFVSGIKLRKNFKEISKDYNF